METRFNAEALHSMERDVTECGVCFSLAGVHKLLKPTDEDDVVETMKRKEVGWEVAGRETDAACNDNAEEQDIGKEIYSVE